MNGSFKLCKILRSRSLKRMCYLCVTYVLPIDIREENILASATPFLLVQHPSVEKITNVNNQNPKNISVLEWYRYKKTSGALKYLRVIAMSWESIAMPVTGFSDDESL